MIFNALSRESALLVVLVVASVTWLFSLFCRAQIEPWERSSPWEAARKISRLVMWCALATVALSLLLNIVRFATVAK
jgi:hypothetical protein